MIPEQAALDIASPDIEGPAIRDVAFDTHEGTQHIAVDLGITAAEHRGEKTQSPVDASGIVRMIGRQGRDMRRGHRVRRIRRIEHTGVVHASRSTDCLRIGMKPAELSVPLQVVAEIKRAASEQIEALCFRLHLVEVDTIEQTHAIGCIHFDTRQEIDAILIAAAGHSDRSERRHCAERWVGIFGCAIGEGAETRREGTETIVEEPASAQIVAAEKLAVALLDCR